MEHLAENLVGLDSLLGLFVAKAPLGSGGDHDELEAPTAQAERQLPSGVEDEALTALHDEGGVGALIPQLPDLLEIGFASSDPHSVTVREVNDHAAPLGDEDLAPTVDTRREDVIHLGLLDPGELASLSGSATELFLKRETTCRFHYDSFRMSHQVGGFFPEYNNHHPLVHPQGFEPRTKRV